MTTGAKAAYGAVIVIGSTTPAEVTDVQGPSIVADTIDVTNHASTDAFREFVAGLLDGGEVTVSANFIKADHTGLFTALKARAAVACTLTLAGSLGAFGFDAIVAGLTTGAPVEDKVSLEITLKITGVVTFT